MSIKNNFEKTVRLSYLDKERLSREIDLHAGYRYVHYIEDERAEGDENPIGTVYLLGYSKKDGSRTCFEISDYPLILWERTDIAEDENSWHDSYGKPIVKKTFDSEVSRRKYVKALKGLENYVERQVVCCDRPTDQFMKEVFLPEAISAEANQGKLRTFYIDIETEISGAFMPPHISANRINMITVLDSETNTFYTWSLQKVKVLEDTTGEGFKYVAYDDFQDSEPVMLRHFVDFWERNYPDVVCGWNSYGFDIPYIICRCEKVIGKAATKRFSPFNEYIIRHELTEERDPETDRRIESPEIENVVLPGISQLDEMKLYKNKFHVKEALDGGYGLGNVGKAEGLGGKVAYETTLLDLYLHDWQKFYEYNVRDVDLLYAIEKKCKLIPLARTICGFGFCNYEDIYQSTSYLVNTLALYTLKNRDHVIFNTYANKFCEKRPYEGAFVFPPVMGRYSGGIACVDFNSLYPSCIRAMNLSPETYVGRLVWPDGEAQWDTWQKAGGVEGLNPDYSYEFIMDRNDVPAPGKSVQLNKEQIKKLLADRCLICGPNLTFFLKHEIKRGVIADWAGDFFAWRKKVKKQAGEAARKSHKEKDKAKKFDLETQAEVLGNLQQAIKIMLNSVYGLLGASSCVLYNPSIVQSVTRLGRFCNINGSRIYRRWLQEHYNISEDYVPQASGDTDSLFLNLQAVTEDLAKQWGISKDLNKWSDDQKLKLWENISKFVDESLIPNVQALVKDLCKTNNSEVLRYGLEYIGSGGIYESKKHYGVHKIVDEGPELVDKFKFTGISIKKAEVPPEIKEFLRNVYCTAIVNPDFDDNAMSEELTRIYGEVKKMSANELGRWQGYGTERKMGEGFLNAEKGMTGTSKAVGFYNQIIKDMGLGKKYGSIEVGDKVQLVYIRPENKYGINVMAFKPKSWPEEFNEVFEIDRPKMFEKIIMSPLENFFEALRFNSSKEYNPAAVADLAYSVDDL